MLGFSWLCLLATNLLFISDVEHRQSTTARSGTRHGMSFSKSASHCRLSGDSLVVHVCAWRHCPCMYTASRVLANNSRHSPSTVFHTHYCPPPWRARASAIQAATCALSYPRTAITEGGSAGHTRYHHHHRRQAGRHHVTTPTHRPDPTPGDRGGARPACGQHAGARVRWPV